MGTLLSEYVFTHHIMLLVKKQHLLHSELVNTVSFIALMVNKTKKGILTVKLLFKTITLPCESISK